MQPDRDKDHRRTLLEELKGLFGPAFGPALEAYGRSFAERLSEDSRFLEEVQSRFERGRALGGFPALDAATHGMTPRERDDFFREGWTGVALPEGTSGTEFWDASPWDGDLEAYREDLYGGMAYAFTDLGQLFGAWLEELSRVGYYGMREASDLPLRRQANDLSPKPHPLPLYGEAFPVRTDQGRPTLWLDLEGPRTDVGYREISVTDEPLRTDAAIFCAASCLEGRQMDVSLVREVLPAILPGQGESFSQTWNRQAEKPETLGSPAPLDYVLHLLRCHRSGFDDLPREERICLITDTCSHINELLAAVKKTLAYVECGSPGKGVFSTSRTANRDVRATVLRDVLELTHREIGARLGVPPPKDVSYKGDHPTVRKMVGRGRKLLYAALGEEGWHLHVESMKADIHRESEAVAEVVAESSNITYETAPEQIEEEQKEEQSRQQDEPA